MRSSNDTGSDREYYILLLQKVYARAKPGFSLPQTLRLSESSSMAAIIREKTGRDIHERTLRNAFKRMHEDTFHLPAPYTLETLAQFALGETNPQSANLSAWLKFIHTANEAPDNALLPSGLPPALPANFPKPLRSILRWGIPLLLTIPIFFWLLAQAAQPRPENFQEDFHDASWKYLESRGWQVLYPDEYWLARQPLRDSGVFTLWTLPGDHWVKPTETRKISNLLVHKLEHSDFSATMKVRHFSSELPYQQVCFLLLDKNLDLANCIRQSIHLNWLAEEENPPVYVELLYFKDGNPSHSGLNPFIETDPPRFNHFATMTLKISAKKNALTAWARPYMDWMPWNLTAKDIALDFTPAYIGIAAFKGLTDYEGNPLQTPIVPAHIDYVHIDYK